MESTNSPFAPIFIRGGISIKLRSIWESERTFSPQVEQKYRNSRWRKDLITCLICVGLIILTQLLNFYKDAALQRLYIHQKDSTLLLLVRVLFVWRIGFILHSILFGGWLFKMLVKPKPFYQKYDRCLFFWLLSLALITSCANFTSPRSYTAETASQIPGLLLFYLIIPQHNFWLRILPSLSFTFIQLALYLFYKTPPAPLNFTSIYSGYILANIIGMVYSNRLYLNERQNFALHLKKDRMVSKLLADKKKLKQERDLVAHYETELRRQEVQQEKVKALQAQIKPHFLFNTLSTIAFYCRNNPMLAYKLVNDLSVYLHSSFKLQSSKIPWEEELKLVNAYVAIEAARMEERLRFSIEEIGDLSECRLPPFTIQPLVENAVRHGLASLPSGGALMIIAREAPDHYYFEVKDNGHGFDPSQKPNNSHNQGKVSGGIGLPNIEERLQGLYGCGLTINSRPGEGTQVSLCIPKQKHHLA